jgi:hypothetical protein
MTVVSELPGRRIIQASVAGTAVFVVVNVVQAIVLDWTRPIGVAVNLVLFAIGCAAFLWSYAVAVNRSRTDEIGVGGLYFLGGTVAPARVRWWLDGALTAQCVVALSTAAARPFTTVAFAILVPMFGIGLNGVWGARHGTFGARRRRPETTNDGDVDAPIDQNAGHG